jgi:HD-like signal output (HDOD) protein
MKRILFVDDEVQVLEGLRLSLRKQRREWDMEFAEGGEAALRQLQSKPFDVIVSDLRMPGMDGASLLERVKDEFPSVVRIILSGHAERDSAMRALPVCHQNLAKPCDGETLKGVIERACNLNVLLQNEDLRRVIGSTDKLPSLPRVYCDLTRAIAKPDVTPKQIAAIVEQDAAISAKLLQLVNSSYFGLARRIAAVEQAIAYLGIELVRSLALTAQVFDTAEKGPSIPGWSFNHLQEQCLLTANVARAILADSKQRDEAFTAALLHDVGKVILGLAAPDQFAKVVASVKSEPQPMHTKEREVLGVTHAEVGAYLLGLWGLPVPIVEAAAYHHTPAAVAQTGLDVLAVVHIADALVGAELPEIPGVVENWTLDPVYLEKLGVLGELPRWQGIAQQQAGRASDA